MGLLSRHFYSEAGPTEHVVVYRGGKEVKSGPGLTAWKTLRTTFAVVPLSVRPVPLQYEEVTGDSQSVLVTGEVSYTLDPEKALKLYDFGLDADGNYKSDGAREADNVARRVIQPYIRAVIRELTLVNAVVAMADVEAKLSEGSEEVSAKLAENGIIFGGVAIKSIVSRNPELTEAIAAKKREELLAENDDAIAKRKMNAAKSDRDIRLYESETAKTLEVERAQLLEERNKNTLAEARADAEASEIRLRSVAENSDALIVESFKELASGGIGTLNVTPEIATELTKLLKRR